MGEMGEEVVDECLAVGQLLLLVDLEVGLADLMWGLEAIVQHLQKALYHEAVFSSVVDLSRIEEGYDFTDTFELSLLYVLPTDVQSHLHEFIRLDLYSDQPCPHSLEAGVQLHGCRPFDDGKKIHYISE